ncbi:hypothetical protein OIDMADRAFT_36559 [Oidiodendron maius Zn]|uniref:Alcohol acetyltransferase n=1 Tax=Oidiodendron maius (strain Zn) TaxID=913774 RepID=A0A0C3D614_OIDMZ|nr:hypothetical protein OIDMADRAFT_36559 [Oidiodendron maius Zn]
MSQPQRLRQVGQLEKYSTTRSHLGLYNNVAVTASYIGVVDQHLKIAVHDALAIVTSQHPNLSAVPVEEETLNPYFIYLTEIEVTQVTTFVKRSLHYDEGSHDAELDEIVQDQHNQPFQHHKPERPFWRLVVLTDLQNESEFMASFVFHHSLADTGSTVIFHECLAAALSRPGANTSKSARVVQTPCTPLLPPLEELNPLTVSEGFAEKARSRFFVHDAPEYIWSAGKTRVPMEVRFRSIAVSVRDTRGFISACKKHHCAVVGPLQTILASTLFSLLPEQYSTLICDGAVSLRRWLNPPVSSKSMGCWVGSFIETYERQQFSWGEARRSRQTIETALSKGGADMAVGCFKYIEDFNEYLSAKIGQPRGTSFEVSNVGAVRPSPVDDSWKLGRVLFSQSANAVGGALKLSVATGNDKGLNLGFSWQNGVLEESFVYLVIQDMLSKIIILGGGDGSLHL